MNKIYKIIQKSFLRKYFLSFSIHETEFTSEQLERETQEEGWKIVKSVRNFEETWAILEKII